MTSNDINLQLQHGCTHMCTCIYIYSLITHIQTGIYTCTHTCATKYILRVHMGIYTCVHIYANKHTHILYITCMFSFYEFQLKNFETLEIKVFHTVKLQCESPKLQKKLSTNVSFTVIGENHLGSPTKPKYTLR